jgi:hypothetical protein
MRQVLEAVREALGPRPRVMDNDTVVTLTPTTPPWLPATDRLAGTYRELDRLLLEGDVVWGALVQANNLLFRPGPNDHPALALYAADRSFDDRPETLQAIARRPFRLKNTTPEDAAERRLADMVTNEMERGLGWMGVWQVFRERVSLSPPPLRERGSGVGCVPAQCHPFLPLTPDPASPRAAAWAGQGLPASDQLWAAFVSPLPGGVWG